MPLASHFLDSAELLDTPLEKLRGVGPKLTEKLKKIGLCTAEDLLYTLPFRYEDRREFRSISQLRQDHVEVFTGRIVSAGETCTSRSRKKIYEILVEDGTGSVALKWFHYRKDWMKRFSVGVEGVFIGEVKWFGGIREIHHPEVELFQGKINLKELAARDPLTFGRILPVYPLTEGLHQKTARKIWKEAVEAYSGYVDSAIPSDIALRQSLLSLQEALRSVHWPPENASLQALESGTDRARQTLVFDEFFFLELGLALKRQGVMLEQGIAFAVEHKYTKPLARLLPFQLTGAQRRVLGEIKKDMMAPHPMNRLIQGDVGCGKTIVALMAALVAIENRTQVAVVAPTEILAEQHFLGFRTWMKALGLDVVLLTGSMAAKARREALSDIAQGRVHMVVGTHAVLQEGVEFKRLGLGIIDEQHRFGVRQRGILRHKGENPDMLVMTATPIPRTLSLTLYGDLALSVIDELPPGRTPVQTRILTEGFRTRGYELISRELQAGRQAYIVYPLVEESEKSDLQAATQGAQELEGYFPGVHIGLIHGRMKSEEKEVVMASFKAGETGILVSTTVIEVGIDVPNATVMMIEHAERFGLAQLHQLRGRVGRGAARSICLLVRSFKCSAEGKKRLEVMAETNDGFRIAEADLEIRGPGEFLGTRQSGLPDFRIANLLKDARILERAKEEAFALASNPLFLSSPEYAQVRKTLVKRWGSRLELVSIG